MLRQQNRIRNCDHAYLTDTKIYQIIQQTHWNHHPIHFQVVSLLEIKKRRRSNR